MVRGIKDNHCIAAAIERSAVVRSLGGIPVAKENAQKEQKATPTTEPGTEPSQESLERARGCFDGADEAARRTNYEYAIALYMQGLRYAPDDVERGHKALYETAVQKKKAGKSKGWSGKTARMKANMLQMAGKKAEAFFAMEQAVSSAPDNHVDLAGLAQSAHNLGLDNTAVFFADRALETGRKAGKLTESLCVQLADIYEAHELWRKAMDTLQEAESHDKTKSGRHMKRIRDLAARTTIGSGLEEFLLGVRRTGPGDDLKIRVQVPCRERDEHVIGVAGQSNNGRSGALNAG